jgi:hypothetical protein
MHNRLYGQSTLKIGEWKSHISFREGIALTQSKDKVIYAASRGLITIDKNDLTLSYLITEDGLSSTTVKLLKYDFSQELLIIVYDDNNIDIIQGGEIINLPFIKNNNSIIGNKDINDVFIDQNGKAYMATSFGLLIFNTEKLEFATTAFTEGLNLQCVATRGNYIYIGSDRGMYKVLNDGTVNIADFNEWKKINSITQDENFIGMASKFDKMYAITAKGTIYSTGKNDDNLASLYNTESGDKLRFITDDATQVIAGIQKSNNGGLVLYIDGENKISTGANCTNLVRDAIEDEKGRIWYADIWEPIRYSLNKTTECKVLPMSGPLANAAGEMIFDKERAYIASRGVTEDYQYTFGPSGFYIYENNAWSNYGLDDIPIMREKEFINIQGIALDPDSKDVVISSYWNGVMSINLSTKTAKHWNKENSTLQGVVGDEARTRVPYIIFDKNKNLWVSNFGAPKPLSVKTPDDKWYSFAVPSNTSLGDISFDDKGNKWIAIVGTGNGLLVHNHGENIASTADDKVRYITKNNSQITGNKVNCVVVDLEGSVWVGTDAGPVVFDCGDPFKEECTGNIRKVVVDGILAPLLRSEDILCIAVDGGNRKWFGTRNGIFVQSPDGSDEIAKYTVDNSPLLDNKVINLSYNGNTGEMIIVSNLGIQSIKTSSLEASTKHSASAYAFPNPVRPEYRGVISIKGLVKDANVKITDINGKLVYETVSVGGLATWDGNDYNGIKAASGVYLVFSSNTDTLEDVDNLVTKIMVIR